MRIKNVAAALLVAIAGSSALALAVPAEAEPTDAAGSSQLDKAFLQALKDHDLQLKSDDAALSLAHSTCDVLSRTGSVNDALQQIKKNTNWTSYNQIGTFGGYAVQAYCPKAMPKS